MAVKIDLNGLCRRITDYSNSKKQWGLKRENIKKKRDCPPPSQPRFMGSTLQFPFAETLKGNRKFANCSNVDDAWHEQAE